MNQDYREPPPAPPSPVADPSLAPGAEAVAAPRRPSIGFGLTALVLVIGLDRLLDRYLPADSGRSPAAAASSDSESRTPTTATGLGAGTASRPRRETPRQRSDRLLAELRAAAARSEPALERRRLEAARQEADEAQRRIEIEERQERERRKRRDQERWYRDYRTHMAPVLELEQELRRRLGTEPVAGLTKNCIELRDRLEAVEPAVFWPADEALGRQARRIATLLARAATSCQERRFFALKSALEEITQARYWLEHRLATPGLRGPRP